MPRSRRPSRYPSVAFRIAGLLESRLENFSLSFSTQREAIDTRQMLYSFGNACDKEANREHKLKHLSEAARYRDLFNAFGRWQLVLDPPYDKNVRMTLDLPAQLHFQLRDSLPKHTQLDQQLDALVSETVPPETPSPQMEDLYQRLGGPQDDS